MPFVPPSTPLPNVALLHDGSTDRFTVPIVGDGNCLFRAVSMFLFRTENCHRLIRGSVVQFMRSKPHLFASFVENNTFSQHLSNMSKSLGTRESWGSHIEIFAIATMLNTDIYVYCLYGNSMRWKVFRPLARTMSPKVSFITLKLQNDHYKTVLPVRFSCFCSHPLPNLQGSSNQADLQSGTKCKQEQALYSLSSTDDFPSLESINQSKSKAFEPKRKMTASCPTPPNKRPKFPSKQNKRKRKHPTTQNYSCNISPELDISSNTTQPLEKENNTQITDMDDTFEDDECKKLKDEEVFPQEVLQPMSEDISNIPFEQDVISNITLNETIQTQSTERENNTLNNNINPLDTEPKKMKRQEVFEQDNLTDIPLNAGSPSPPLNFETRIHDLENKIKPQCTEFPNIKEREELHIATRTMAMEFESMSESGDSEIPHDEFQPKAKPSNEVKENSNHELKGSDKKENGKVEVKSIETEHVYSKKRL